MATLKQKFSSMSKREQMMVAACAIVVVIAALYLLVLAPFYASIDKRSERVVRKSEDLAWMHSVAPELQSAPQGMTASPAGNPGESLVVLVDRTARDTGLANALTGQTPNGPNSIRVRFEGAAFDTLVMWMGQLVQQHGVHIDQVSLDRTGEPGLVNASFVLNRAAA